MVFSSFSWRVTLHFEYVFLSGGSRVSDNNGSNTTIPSIFLLVSATTHEITKIIFLLFWKESTNLWLFVFRLALSGSTAHHQLTDLLVRPKSDVAHTDTGDEECPACSTPPGLSLCLCLHPSRSQARTKWAHSSDNMFENSQIFSVSSWNCF